LGISWGSLWGHCAAAAEGRDIASRFQRLTRASAWHLVRAVDLDFDAHHPQGLARVGSRFFLSAVEVHDRARGEGIGHLFELDEAGHLLRQTTLGRGSIYHPGGIDYDGRSLWVPVAEYRPESHSLVYRVKPGDLQSAVAFEWPDHLGALVADGRRLVGVSWGSRRYYSWRLRAGDSPRPPSLAWVATNGSYYVDYQDGQALAPTGLALFSGVATLGDSRAERFSLGGLELVNLSSGRVLHQLPVTLRTSSGVPMTQNPFHVGLQGNGLRFWFLPEDGRGRLYVYDVE